MPGNASASDGVEGSENWKTSKYPATLRLKKTHNPGSARPLGVSGRPLGGRLGCRV